MPSYKYQYQPLDAGGAAPSRDAEQAPAAAAAAEPRSPWRRRATRAALAAWMLLVAAASAAVLLRRASGGPCARAALAVAADATGNLPAFPVEARQFDFVPDYTVDASETSDAEVAAVEKRWSALMPTGRGWFQPTDPGGLTEPSVDSEGQSVHAVVVFHELHCLYVIMRDYNNAVRNRTTAPRHTRHCFEYLRLTLMCHADTTVEGLPDVLAETMFQPDVVGSTHVCRDFEYVRRWVDDHGANNETGILQQGR